MGLVSVCFPQLLLEFDSKLWDGSGKTENMNVKKEPKEESIKMSQVAGTWG